MRTLPLLLLTALVLSVSSVRAMDMAGHDHGAPSTDWMAPDNQHLHGTVVAEGVGLDVTPAQAVVTEEKELTIKGSKKTYRLYIAKPKETQGPLPAVVLIHEWWGLNDNIETMARLLAGEGYVVGAVDVYGEPPATEAKDAVKLYTGATTNQKRTTGLMEMAADTLLARDDTAGEQVGVMGWCFGGNQTLQAAIAMGPKVQAAVVYYGIQITSKKKLEQIKAPVLGLYGAKDHLIPENDIKKMHGTLKELGIPTEYKIYEGAGHAFANPSGTNDNYQPEAAADAWKRTLDWLGKYMKGGQDKG